MEEVNPGSKEAGKLGCTCAVLDNNHGHSPPWPPDGWWITRGCPVHDPVEEAPRPCVACGHEAPHDVPPIQVCRVPGCGCDGPCDVVFPPEDVDVVHVRGTDGRCRISFNGQGHFPCDEHPARPVSGDTEGLQERLDDAIEDAWDRTCLSCRNVDSPCRRHGLAAVLVVVQPLLDQAAKDRAALTELRRILTQGGQAASSVRHEALRYLSEIGVIPSTTERSDDEGQR